MDVRTGVLALVSLPDFDPNARDFAGGDSGRNIMAQDVYELGSVFKIFSFAMAIENRTVEPRRVDRHRQRLQDRPLHHPRSRAHAGDARWRATCWRSPRTSARRRSRCAPARPATRLPRQMGLLTPLASELPETRPPALPSPLGHRRDGNHRFRPRGFRQPAVFRRGGGRRSSMAGGGMEPTS